MPLTHTRPQRIPALIIVLIISLFAAFPLSAGDAEGNFVVNFAATGISWNPQNSFSTTEAQIYTALYEGLVSNDPVNCRPVPGIAERWDISRDRKTYTFYLREGLTFSDGTPITAGMVRDSWLDLMAPDSTAEYAANLDIIENGRAYRTGEVKADMVGIKTNGDRILVVRLQKPAAHFLSILTHYTFVPVHPDFIKIKDWSDLKSFPTNGPFEIKSRTDTEVVLVKSDRYWDKDNVALPGIRIMLSDDNAEVMKRFNRYEIDWIDSGIDFNMLLIREAIVVGPQFCTSYLFFNNGQKPFDNPDVRRALGLLIPWPEIRGEQLIPGQTLVPPIPTYPTAKSIIRKNRTEALTLLEKNGFAEGKGLPDIVIRSPYPEGEDKVAMLIKETWEKELGVKVTISYLPFKTYYDSLSDGEYTIGMMIWVGDYPDPLTFLEMWETGHSLNESHYSNPEYDKALDRASSALPEERFRLLSEAESMLLTTSQVMPVEHLPSVNLIDVRFVDGWYVNALDLHPFKYLKFKNGLIIPGSI